MSSVLLALAGAVSFLCADPSHHDGDNVRCANLERPIRLQGIDAPEMPGACRPGRDCTPGDPFAARDHLRRLSRGHELRCTPEGTDDYGRVIARCAADGVDLSCAMIASGHAVPRYAPIDCSQTGPSRERASPAPPVLAAAPVARLPAAPVAAPPTDWAQLLLRALGSLLWLAVMNGALWLFVRPFWPAEEETWLQPRPLNTHVYLGLAALGGSPAALASIWLRNPGEQQEGLEQPLIIITGLHIGLLLGVLVLLIW